MAFYLGNQPLSTAQRLVTNHAGGTDTFYVTYTPGFIDVYLNGVLLHSDDYTATSGDTIVLNEAAGASDEVVTVSWSTFNIGAQYVEQVDNYADTTNYTSGTTAQLTLTQAVSTEKQIMVYFDGVYQHHDTYTVSGTTVTFSSAIPLGTDNVEIMTRAALPITDSYASGGGTDHIFWENGQTVNSSYTIGGTTNAMSAGPITIGPSATVTISSGGRWVIV